MVAFFAASAGPSLISDQPARSGRIEGRLPPLIVLPAVPVISSIAAVPIIFAEFGSPAMAVLVLFLPRPTLSAAGLIRPTGLILAAGLILTTLSVVWVHCVIEIANDVVEALRGSGMCNWNCSHKYDGSSGAKQPSIHREFSHY